MTEMRRKYEEMYEREARVMKEDKLKELSAFDKEQTKRVAAGEEEARAIAGPYSYTVKELMAQVEKERGGLAGYAYHIVPLLVKSYLRSDESTLHFRTHFGLKMTAGINYAYNINE